MHKIVLAVAFFLVWAASPVAAQDQRAIVARFDDSTISRLLLDVNAQFQIQPGAEGVNVYRARAGEGIAFTVSPGACSDKSGCLGLVLVAVFTLDDGSRPPDLDQRLHRYNDVNPNAKVYRADRNVVVLQGYINAAYGISYRNAQAQLLVFGQEIGKLRDTLGAMGEAGESR
ncbi:MAG: hypothetical protein RIB52_08040 [Erythrobacter sp.]|uniref:hypothetical protein n=1 Tax=Erythrobacter sp. TaxID=1042 RepID=UPI0032EFA3DA